MIGFQPSKNKHSQMELMGLAIIVILLSIGMLFVIRFNIFRQGLPNQATEYAHSELAANFLNTMLATNAPECSDIKFSTLLQDCVNNKGMGGTIPCDTIYSCEYIEQIIPKLFEETFDQWRISYFFIISTDIDYRIDSKVFNPLGEECTGNRKGKIQPLPSNPPIYISLDICS